MRMPAHCPLQMQAPPSYVAGLGRGAAGEPISSIKELELML